MIRQAKKLRAAGYIRMSTDRQEDSPARQKEELKSLVKREGWKQAGWYSDHAQTGTESANRPGFQRLLADAAKHKFDLVAVHEQSRFSREDLFRVMEHWSKLDAAGVKIATSRRGVVDFNELGSMLTAIIDAHEAREESVKLAHRCTMAKKLAAQAGKRIGGRPFAYDRQIRDAGGAVIRVVSFRERFTRPQGWTSHLIPSAETEAVEAVRRGYRMIKEGKTCGDVAYDWNVRGIRTLMGNEWDAATVKTVLRNPVYVGVLRCGVYCNGKFRRIDEDGIIEIEDAHPPLIGKQLFSKVQEILDSTTRRHDATHRGSYPLSGLVYCAICGKPMYGTTSQFGSVGKKRSVRVYRCQGTRKLNAPRCVHPCLQAETLERFVGAQVERHLLGDDAASALEAAIKRGQEVALMGTQNEEARLKRLREKLARGVENLALASAENIEAIETLLKKWREEIKALETFIKGKRAQLPANPKRSEVIADLARYRMKLSTADFLKLSGALQKTIAEVRVAWKMVNSEGKSKHREWFGELRFHPGLGCDEPIQITHDDIGLRQKWMEISEYVCAQGRPVGLRELMDVFKYRHHSPLVTHLNGGVASGRIEKSTPRHGWQAKPFTAKVP